MAWSFFSHLIRKIRSHLIGLSDDKTLITNTCIAVKFKVISGAIFHHYQVHFITEKTTKMRLLTKRISINAECSKNVLWFIIVGSVPDFTGILDLQPNILNIIYCSMTRVYVN